VARFVFNLRGKNMSKETEKKEESKKTLDRKSFQEMVKSAKKMDFESDNVYIPCPELGEGQRLKLHAMLMDDHMNMRDFNKTNEGCQLWICVVMFSAKDEDGGYIFTEMDDYLFIQSMGVKWYMRFGVTAMEMAGYLEEFIVEKK